MKAAKLYAVIVAVGTSIASATGTRVVREPDRLQRRDGQQIPSAVPVPNKQTSHGCYSSGGNMTKVDVQHMSSGSCVGYCITKKYWVAGLNGQQCLCGYAYPPTKSHEDDKKCDYPCPFYPQEACGGLSNGNGGTGYYSIFNTGVNIDVNNYEPPKSSSTKSSTSSTATSTSSSSHTASTTQASTEAASTTAVSPVTSTADSDKDDKSSGPNVAAIAAGVVAGVVVVAAAIAGGFFYLRRKRNAEIEEEHRRNAAVNAFISGSQPPSTSGSISMTDSRLDPVMAHRRLSDGSIADNQDYSRKILRVTNA